MGRPVQNGHAYEIFQRSTIPGRNGRITVFFGQIFRRETGRCKNGPPRPDISVRVFQSYPAFPVGIRAPHKKGTAVLLLFALFYQVNKFIAPGNPHAPQLRFGGVKTMFNTP